MGLTKYTDWDNVWSNLDPTDLPGEKWLPVDWCKEGRVLCSSFGRVKSIYNHKSQERVIKQINNFGYRSVQIQREGKRKNFSVHRLVAKLFIENKGSRPEVNHINGKKHDNRYFNLEWCTRKENMRHAADFLLRYSGTNSARSKFTESDVLDIFYSNGTDREVAKKYGVSHSVIGFIRRKKSYKNILKNHHREPVIFNSQKRLTKSDIIGIYNSNLSYKKTGELYGVKEGCVFLIKKGKRHSDITGHKKI